MEETLKERFEAELQQYIPKERWNNEFSEAILFDMMTAAYNMALPQWIDSGVEIPVNRDKVLISDGTITKTAFFDTDKGKWQISGYKITPKYWMPMPTPPNPDKD